MLSCGPAQRVKTCILREQHFVFGVLLFLHLDDSDDVSPAWNSRITDYVPLLCPPPLPLWALVCLSEIWTGSPPTLPIPPQSAHFSRTLNKLIWALIIQGAYFITFDSPPPIPAAAAPPPPPSCSRRRPAGGAVPGNLAPQGAASSAQA